MRFTSFYGSFATHLDDFSRAARYAIPPDHAVAFAVTGTHVAFLTRDFSIMARTADEVRAVPDADLLLRLVDPASPLPGDIDALIDPRSTPYPPRAGEYADLIAGQTRLASLVRMQPEPAAAKVFHTNGTAFATLRARGERMPFGVKDVAGVAVRRDGGVFLVDACRYEHERLTRAYLANDAVRRGIAHLAHTYEDLAAALQRAGFTGLGRPDARQAERFRGTGCQLAGNPVGLVPMPEDGPKGEVTNAMARFARTLSKAVSTVPAEIEITKTMGWCLRAHPNRNGDIYALDIETSQPDGVRNYTVQAEMDDQELLLREALGIPKEFLDSPAGSLGTRLWRLEGTVTGRLSGGPTNTPKPALPEATYVTVSITGMRTPESSDRWNRLRGMLHAAHAKSPLTLDDLIRLAAEVRLVASWSYGHLRVRPVAEELSSSPRRFEISVYTSNLRYPSLGDTPHPDQWREVVEELLAIPPR